jgi:hypothetical protein
MIIFWTLFVQTAVAQIDSTLLRQVNDLRPGYELAYNREKQASVDKYAASKGFDMFIHSGAGDEILCESLNGKDFIDSWMRSKPHRKIMLDKKFKSMTSRVVKIRDRRYIAVIRFY